MTKLSLMPSPAVRAIFFDAVGTLIDPDPPAPVVYAQLGRRFGSRHDAAVIKPRFAKAFEDEEHLDRLQGWRTSEAREVERWRRIVAKVLDDVADQKACFQALFDHFSRPEAWRCAAEAGTILIELLKQGFILGMASNYDSRLRAVVAGKPELTAIQHLCISSEIGWRKPAPEFFAAVCQSVGLSAEQILFVGDDPMNDIVGAQIAGLTAVLYDPAGRFPLHRLKIDYLPIRIRQLADLLALLRL